MARSRVTARSGQVGRVPLLGAADALKQTRDAVALHVKLPEWPPGDYVYILEISGNSLTKA